MAGEAMTHVQGESLKVIAVVYQATSGTPPATSTLLVAGFSQGSCRWGRPYVQSAYSVLADALSKFQSSPEWIKALWLMGPPLTVLGVTWLVTKAAREIAGTVLARREGALQGHPLYAIYQDRQGRLMLYAKGVARELTGGTPPDIDRLPPPARHQ